MSQFNFNVLSLNVRGLRDYKKNVKIFNWIVKHDGETGITFLQETHSTQEIVDEWSKRTRGKLIMSHGTSKSKGTAILFGSKLPIQIKQQILDTKGRYVIVYCEIQGNDFLLVNSYLPNYESEQVLVLNEIVRITNTIEYSLETQVIWGGDFNFIFDLNLEASGGNPSLKLESIETMETIMTNCDLCDIWRIRNSDKKRYTWSGKAQGISSKRDKVLRRRLDYFFISDELQPYVEKCDIIPAPSTDHSAITLKFKSFESGTKGPSFWKFNNSLAENTMYCTSIKIHIRDVKISLDNEGIINPQLRWELIKYEIRKFTIKFSKGVAKNRRTAYKQIELEITEIENTNGWEDDEILVNKHDSLLKSLEEESNYITEGIIIRSKAIWYECGEKNTRYFLNLEKRNKIKTHVRKIKNKEGKEMTNSDKVLRVLKDHFNSLFQSKSRKTENECSTFLEKIHTPFVTNIDKRECGKSITTDECLKALKQMGRSKTPGNDGLTKELYLCLWSELKNDLVDCLNYNFEVGSLSTSQNQIIITLLEKPGKDNRFLEAWRPISLINVDVKICSRVLSNRIKSILPTLVDPDQAAFIKGRNIDEPIRIIQDIMHYTHYKDKYSLLFAADFEKAFDSIEHNFIFAVLRKFGFDENFIKWIKILLTNNQSCVINNGKATEYFHVSRGTKQGDPISPYIFILVIEVIAIMMRSCEDIKGVNLDGKTTKLVLFADDTTFFLQDIDSFSKVLDLLERFYNFSSLKINLKKSEVGWLGRKNHELPQISCDIQNINFHQKGIRILGVYFSYDDKYVYENNFKRILTNFQTTLSIWKTRNLTLYGKIQVLRSLALPKLIFVCSVLHVSEDFIKIVESTIQDFIWNGRKAKIKHSTLIGEYEMGGLKLPDFQSCLKANRVKWAIRLILSSKLNTKLSIIPSIYLQNIGGFHQINNNFDRQRIPKYIPAFYKSILTTWSEIAEIDIDENPTLAYNQHLWNNKYIRIGDKSIFYKDFSEFNINKIADLCDSNYEFKWEYAKDKGIQDKDFLRWAGIIHTIPASWKILIKGKFDCGKQLKKCLTKCLQLGGKTIELQKIQTKHIYQWFMEKKFNPPTAQKKLSQRIHQDISLDWKEIYNRIYRTSIDTYSRFFQYKVLNNILYLNRDLNRFKLIDHPSCSFCSQYPETVDHLFVECIESKNLYFEIRNHFKDFGVILPESNIKNIVMGVDDPTANYIILIFKILLYKTRDKGKIPSLSIFKNTLNYYKKIENKAAKEKEKLPKHILKWKKIDPGLI